MLISRCAALLAAGALAAGGLAACGGSDDASGESDGTTTASTANASLEGAKRDLAPALKYPDSIGIDAPLKGSVKGNTIEYVECGVTECKVTGDQLAEAVKPLGMKLVRIPAGNTPESLARAFDQVVEDRPNGVVASGISKSLFAAQLAKLRKANIPVVLTGSSDAPGDGIAQVLIGPQTWSNEGAYGANWTVVDSNAKANVLLVTAPVFDFNKPLAAGFKGALARNCPDCSVHEMGVAADDIGKGVPGQIVSYLQKKPETNYVATAFGSLMIGVPQAIKAAGLQDKVNLVALTASQLDFQGTKAGQIKTAVGASKQYLGWMVVDQLARAMTGEDPAKLVNDSELPWWHVFGQDDVDWDVKKEPDWPYFDGFRDQFKRLWGVE